MKHFGEMIYVDDDLIVVNKSAGMLSVPDRHDPEKANLASFIESKYADARPLHRLDYQTSGLICFARGTSAFRHFSAAFSGHTTEKYYQALVLGVPSRENALIDEPLQRKSHKNYVIVSKNGKPARTYYQRVASFGTYAQLSIQILTGRTHQIRVHLQSIGHPLMVDPVYGGKSAFYLSEIKPAYRNRHLERPLLARTPLHANKLVLPMLDGGSQEFSASLPKDMKAVIHQLRRSRSR